MDQSTPATTATHPLRIGLLALALIACSPESPDEPGSAPAESASEVVARDQAAGYFELGDWAQARAAMAPLVQGPEARVEDLVRAASIEFDDTSAQPEAAKRLLDRALALAPDDSTVHWGLYRHFHGLYEFEPALEHLRVTSAAYPEDIPTIYALAATLAELEQPEEAEQRFLQLIAIGPDFGESWYAGALYRYSTFLLETGRGAEADSFRREFAELGIEGPTPKNRLRGTFGQ